MYVACRGNIYVSHAASVSQPNMHTGNPNIVIGARASEVSPNSETRPALDLPNSGGRGLDPTCTAS